MKAQTNPVRVSSSFVLGLALLGAAVGLRPCGAATVLKSNNTAALNTGASWVGGAAPGSGDTAQWDATVTGANAVGLGGNLSWLGLNLGDYTSTNWSSPGGGVTITNTGNTLTLGAGGVNMSLAGTNLTLGATVQIGASQTWNVYNGLTLTLGTNVSGSGNLTKLGAGTVQFNGASGFSGTNIIGGGTVQLNFNGAGNPPLTNLLNPTLPLVFNDNGGLLQMLGTTNRQTQSFSNVLLLAGESGITVTPGAGTTTNYLGLGGLLRGPGGGVVNFSLASTNAFIQVTNSNVNGILGPWATYGPSGYNTATNLASVDPNGFIIPYTGWVDYVSSLSGLNPVNNLRVTSSSSGNVAVANGGAAINTLVDNDPAARTVFIRSYPVLSFLRLGAVGGILRANGAGVLSVGDVPANNGSGRLTAGGATNLPGELIFNVQDGGGNKTTTQLILNATIVDNGSGPVTTTFTGGGAVAVNSTNTYSGSTYILNGRVTLNAAGTTLGTGPIYISGAPLSAWQELGAGNQAVWQVGGSLFLGQANTPLTNSLYLSGGGGADTAGGALRANGNTVSGTITLLGDTVIGYGNYNGSIGGTGNLYLNPTSQGTLTFGTSNNYAGDTILMNNKLVVSQPGGLPAGGLVVLGQGTGTAAAANFVALELHTNTTVAGLSEGTLLPTGARYVTNGSGGPLTLTLSNNTRNVAYSGLIADSSSAPLSLVKNGTYTQTLLATNTFSGNTRLANGVLALGSSFAAQNSTLVVQSGDPGTLNAGSLTSVNFAGLSGNGALGLTNGVGGPLLLVVGSSAFSSASSNALSGSGGLQKVGGQTLSLAGVNTYSGATLISTGTLQLAVGGSISNSAQVVVGAGATLDASLLSALVVNGAAGQVLAGSGSVLGNVMVGSGATLSPGTNSSSAGTLSFANLTLAGGSTNVFALSPYPGGTPSPSDEVIVNGTLMLSGTNNVIQLNPLATSFGNGTYVLFRYGYGMLSGPLSSLQVAPIPGYTATLDELSDGTGPFIGVVIQPQHVPEAITWQGDGANNDWNTSTPDWTNSSGQSVAFGLGDNVTFDDTGSGVPAVNLQLALAPGSVTVASLVENYTLTGSGKITGATALTMAGSSLLTILGNNDYQGGTVINQGTLQVGNGGTNGWLGSGPIQDNGTLIFNLSNATVLAQNLSGTGSFTAIGGGTMTLSGNNSGFSGPVTNTGALVMNDWPMLGSGSSVTLNNGQLQLLTGGTPTFTMNLVLGAGGGAISNPAVLNMATPIVGTGAFTKNGAGLMYFSAANSYAGATMVNAGTLQIDSGGAVGAAPGNVGLNGGSLVYDRSDNYVQPGFLSGNSTNSSITSSDGPLTLAFGSGSNTFGTIVNGTANALVLTGANASTNYVKINQATGGGSIVISNGVFASPDQTGTAGNWTLAGGTFQITGVRLGMVGTPTGQTMTIAGGNLSLLTTAQYGFRLGGVNGPALTGNSNASVLQVSGTATLLGPTGAGALQIGGTGVSVTNLYTLSGGAVYLGSGNQSQSLLLGADTNGTSLAQFSLWGGELTSAGTISGSQAAGARQVFDFSGGILAAATVNATNLAPAAMPTVQGTFVNNGGTLAPGGSNVAGRTIIIGNYAVSNAAAVLAIDLGGTNAANAFTNAAGYYDTVTVNGNAILGGNLNLSLINGYEPYLPLSSPSFTVLTASNLTGAFANVVSGSRLAVTGYPNRSFRVTVTATNVVLDQYQTTTPQAYFTCNPHSGSAPLAVTFTNLSNGSGLTNLWSFGDGGSSTSTAATVTHTYTNPGTNTVSLTVGSAVGVNTYTVTNAVAVTASSGPTGNPVLTNSVSGTILTLSWGAGWLLAAQTNPPSAGLGNAWVTNPTATSPLHITMDPSKGSVFYKLVP